MEFTKNPISTYDETTLKISFTPLITFPYPIESIEISFSDQSLDKVIASSVEFKANETLNYEINIYVDPKITGVVTLFMATISVKLPE